MSDLKHFRNFKKCATTVKTTFPHRKQDILFNLSENHRGDSSVADPDAVFFTPWSGREKKSGSGSGMNIPDHISESLKQFLG
jgi:hypothetical protein